MTFEWRHPRRRGRWVHASLPAEPGPGELLRGLSRDATNLRSLSSFPETPGTAQDVSNIAAARRNLGRIFRAPKRRRPPRVAPGGLQDVSDVSKIRLGECLRDLELALHAIDAVVLELIFGRAKARP